MKIHIRWIPHMGNEVVVSQDSTSIDLGILDESEARALAMTFLGAADDLTRHYPPEAA